MLYKLSWGEFKYCFVDMKFMLVNADGSVACAPV